MRRLVALPVAFVALGLAAAGCKHDGREMRPALPSQNGSVSTSAPSTVPDTENDFFETTAPTTSIATTTTSASTTSSTSTSTSTSTTLGAPVPVLTAPWRDGAAIDPRYTCKGPNVSPALSWNMVPEGTQEIAVALIDQDASFDHWAMTGIPPDRLSLAEGEIPQGAAVALNGNGAAAYTGPCPPAGATHTYRITIYFLNRALQLTAGGAAADMRTAIDAATLASAQVTGTFAGT